MKAAESKLLRGEKGLPHEKNKKQKAAPVDLRMGGSLKFTGIV